MTAHALLTIPERTIAHGGSGSARGRGHEPQGAGAFGATLRRVAGFDPSAGPAPIAQALPDAAQERRSGAGNAAGDDPAEQGGRERDGEPGAASVEAPAVPLTIDGLNALLLVGGQRRDAGSVARAELRSAVPSSAAATGGGESGPPAAPGQRRAKDSAPRADLPTTPSDDTRPEPRAHERIEAARDQRGRSEQDVPKDRGDGGRPDGRARPQAEQGRPAPAVPASDPMRALAARALASPAGARGVERAQGGPGSSPFVLRAAGVQRGDGAARAAKAPEGAPAAGAARREALAAQMSRILTTAAAKGGGTMMMRLAPESLGAVTVRIGVEDGAVTARFEAATAAARDLLDASLSALRSSLEAKGLSVDRLQVELAPMDPRRAPEDQGATGETGHGPELGGGHGEEKGGGSADGRAGESGAHHDGACEGAERPVAAVPGDRTDAVGGTDHRGEVVYLGLDAVA